MLFTFVPFLVGDGIALGVYIGNNHTQSGLVGGTGHPDHKINSDLLMVKKLPKVENNGVTSEGYVEEELWHETYDFSDDIEYSEVWMYAYREIGGALFSDGTVVQSYLQIEDPEKIGELFSFTCTATYK